MLNCDVCLLFMDWVLQLCWPSLTHYNSFVYICSCLCLRKYLSSTFTSIITAILPHCGILLNGSQVSLWLSSIKAVFDLFLIFLRAHCFKPLCCYSDLNCLTSSAPPAATEWQSLLRPLRGREPEGIWNLLSIVRELFRRQDSNAVPLLETLTDEMLQCEQVSLHSTAACCMTAPPVIMI